MVRNAGDKLRTCAGAFPVLWDAQHAFDEVVNLVCPHWLPLLTRAAKTWQKCTVRAVKANPDHGTEVHRNHYHAWPNKSLVRRMNLC